MKQQRLSDAERRATAAQPLRRLKIDRGSGNVFEDVGFSAGEAENLLLRAQLMPKIRSVARGMTQAQAAKRFGVSQPRLNEVLRGKIDKFSLDALVDMLAAVDVNYRQCAAPAAPDPPRARSRTR